MAGGRKGGVFYCGGRKGRTVEDLSEPLWELGYLREHDGRELHALLDQAETGKPVWSLHRNQFDDAVDDAARPSDRDWHFRPRGLEVDEDGSIVPVRHAAEAEQDFTVTGEHGEAVPARPLTREDFDRLIEEERHADEWFRREAEGAEPDAGPAEQRGGLPLDGGAGLSARAGDTVEGRAGDQSGAGKAGGGAKLDRPYLSFDERETAITRLQSIAQDEGRYSGRLIRDAAEFGAPEEEIAAAIRSGDAAVETLADAYAARSGGLKQGFGTASPRAPVFQARPTEGDLRAEELTGGRRLYDLPENQRASLLKAARVRSVDAFESLPLSDRLRITRQWMAESPAPGPVRVSQAGAEKPPAGNRLQFSENEFGYTISMHDLVSRAREFARRNFAGKTVTVGSDGSQVLIPWSGIKHTFSQSVSKAAAIVSRRLDQLIEHGIPAGSAPDHSGRAEIKAVHFYDTPVRIGDSDATIRLVVRENPDGKRFYDHYELREAQPGGNISGDGLNDASIRPHRAAPAETSPTDTTIAGIPPNGVRQHGPSPTPLQREIPPVAAADAAVSSSGSGVPAETLYQRRVRHAQTDTVPSGITHVKSAADAAHVVAPFRKGAQEDVLAVVTDGDGQVLAVHRVHKGGKMGASAEPGTVAAVVVNTPGAKRVWLAHNHPSGDVAQTPDDLNFSGQVHDLLRGSGVDLDGMIAVGPGGKHYSVYTPGGEIPARARTGQVPVLERRLVGRTSQAEPVTSTEKLQKAFDDFPDESGVLILDGQARPVGFVPLSADDMLKLRQGEGGPSARLLKTLDETNGSLLAARVKGADEATRTAAGKNLAAFARKFGGDLWDVLDKAGASHVGNHGDFPAGGTFHANPFHFAAREIARDLKLPLGRQALQMFPGAVAGATASDDEPGSPGWWLDVASGAVLSKGAFTAGRVSGLTGKSGAASQFLTRLGKAIDGLPLIGRGPEDLRVLKGQQRVMRQLIERQTAEIGTHLLKRFTPAERAQMADLIEGRGIVKDFNLIHRQARELDDYLAHVGERMKALGMLPEDLETGGYLHRYYEKWLGKDALLKGQRESLAGSYTIARGTDDQFHRNYFSPGARAVLDDFEEAFAELESARADLKKAETKARKSGNADLFPEELVAREKAAAERLASLRKRELVEYVGDEGGKLKSYLFAKGEAARVPGPSTGLRTGIEEASRIFEHREAALDPRNLPVAPVKNLQPTDRVWTLRGTKGDDVTLHRDWTEAERKAWGEIKDSGYRFVRHMQEAAHDLSLATLFKKVAGEPEWVSDAPRQTNGKDWVLVSDAKVNKDSALRRHGALAGKYVRPDVWAGIKNYGRPPFGEGPVGKLYRAALNKWKLYKTVYNPVTHFNNSFSNAEMLFMAGYDGQDLHRGLQEMRLGEKSALWREAQDNGLFGATWTDTLIGDGEGLRGLAEQLRTQPEVPDAAFTAGLMMDVKHWWINSKNALAEADGKWQTGAALAKAMAAPAMKGVKFTLKPVDAAARAMERAYRFEDNVFKMAVYAAERAKGTTPGKAVQAANRYFFDYADLPQAVKVIRDLPVGAPFISYTYQAIPAIARNIAERPERWLALVAGIEAVNYAASVIDGVGPGEYWETQQAEELLSPPWDRGRSLSGMRNAVRVPYLDGYRLALGNAHAAGNPFASEAGGREVLPQMPVLGGAWGSSILGGSPVHALVDTAINEDWKGKPIYHKTDDAEQKARKVAAYLYQAWAPSNAAVPGGRQQTKILESLANTAAEAKQRGETSVIRPIVDLANNASAALGFGQFTGLDKMENPILTRDAVLGSFGVRLRPDHFEQSLDLATSDAEKRKRELARQTKRAVREGDEGRKTEGQVEADVIRLEGKREKVNQDMEMKFDAFEFLRKQGRGR